MRKSFQHLWFQFLDGLPNNGLTAIELLRMLLQFLRDCSQALNEEPLLIYGLNRFAMLNAEDYPVEFTSSSESEVSHLLVVLRRSKNKKTIFIAQLLRDVFEQLLVVESNRDCPNCMSGGMGIYKNRADGRFVLQCKHCGHSVYLDDGSKTQVGQLILAMTSELRDADLIPS